MCTEYESAYQLNMTTNYIICTLPQKPIIWDENKEFCIEYVFDET